MAKIIDGNALSNKILQLCQKLISDSKVIYPNFKPSLAIVQVGDRKDSNSYIKKKLQSAANIGLTATHYKFEKTITEAQLKTEINKLNRDETTNGIIVQLPLDCVNKISADNIINTVDHSKDVDGLNLVSAGKLSHGQLEDTFIPCTPKGCLELLNSIDFDCKGKRVVVIGKSKLVGIPISTLLSFKKATVTLCCDQTVNLPEICKQADLLIVAIGDPKFITTEYVKPGAVVIDVGINPYKDHNNKVKICGDVDFQNVSKIASYITPVPGGVGPMTVSMLLLNTIESAIRFHGKNSEVINEKTSIGPESKLDTNVLKYAFTFIKKIHGMLKI